MKFSELERPIGNREALFQSLTRISELILAGDYEGLSKYSTEDVDISRQEPIKDYVETYPYNLLPWSADFIAEVNFLYLAKAKYIIEVPFVEFNGGVKSTADIQMIIEYDDETLECDFLRVEIL